MRAPLKVALFIEQTSSHTRGIAQGISLYAKTHGPWFFLMGEEDGGGTLIAPPLESLKNFTGDGIIAYTRNEKLLQELIKSKLPVVNTAQTSISNATLPSAYTDDEAAGRCVAEYFLDRGFKEFAYCGSAASAYWSIQRRKGFTEHINQKGFTVSSFDPKDDLPQKINWKQDKEDLLCWLQSLHKPVALFADNDSCGRILAELCIQLQIHVPEEIAIVGADNEELICEFSNPSLSSVALAKEQVGFEAAGLLEQIIRKSTCPPEPILVPPLGITTRRSSDIFAVEDKHVAEALNFIHNHAGEQISVADVLEQIPLCRRYLELRFRKATGRSPYEEIRKAHVQRAKRLLSETNLHLEQIAEASGFSDTKHFYMNFRKEVNMSPMQYRKQFKVIEASNNY